MLSISDPGFFLSNTFNVIHFYPWYNIAFCFVLVYTTFVTQKTCHITSTITKRNIKQKNLRDFCGSELGSQLLDPQLETQNWPPQKKCLVRLVLLEKGNLMKLC